MRDSKIVGSWGPPTKRLSDPVLKRHERSSAQAGHSADASSCRASLTELPERDCARVRCNAPAAIIRALARAVVAAATEATCLLPAAIRKAVVARGGLCSANSEGLLRKQTNPPTAAANRVATPAFGRPCAPPGSSARKLGTRQCSPARAVVDSRFSFRTASVPPDPPLRLSLLGRASPKAPLLQRSTAAREAREAGRDLLGCSLAASVASACMPTKHPALSTSDGSLASAAAPAAAAAGAAAAAAAAA
eukprot:CAMPEP_0115589570 /NCGR_PEP_ID=MMETSP0272-20121206/9317_1 /TAXON_ID=71861 /ORGANISM="Scrippsiella trochoidea, Strain CCMP3099" /LENGTH=248 /DNA_ID=CAMNT_0003024739 /DNA_START=370 /DNA_END=1114 /DNA_ORIENTATION=-